MRALRAEFTTGGVDVQFVPSAMWPGYRGGTSSKRATRIHQRDHAYHSSAKLGNPQQMRYHR